MQKVAIRDEIASLSAYWSQKIIAEANGQLFWGDQLAQTR